jgi:hypothetical protein
MQDGNMLLPNAVEPEHAAAASDPPARRLSATSIAISLPCTRMHEAALAGPSDQRAICGGEQNFPPCVGKAAERARSATVCDLIPLVRHTLIHSGTSLRHHYVSMQKTLLRTDPWRVFLSKRVMTAFFTVNWARAVYFLLGAIIFLNDPAANSSFEQASESTAFKARLLRFTTLQLRNGQRSSITHHGLAKVGVLRRGCELVQTHTVSHDAASATLAFSKPVTFDGWWLETRQAEAALDPVIYVLEYSDNGTDWRVFASSRRGDVCGYRGAQQTKAYVTEYLLTQDSVREPSMQRGVKETVTFESSACLLPTHLVQVAQKFFALSFVTTPIIAIFLHETLTPPAQILGLASTVAGILKIIAAAILAVNGRSHEIPASYIQYTNVTIITESLLGIFFFPGLAIAFDERFSVEGLLVLGIGQTVSNYASGMISIMGPVAVIFSLIIVGIREHHFFKGRTAVNEDQRKFHEAWARIQEESGTKEAQERLHELTHNFQRIQMRPGHASSRDVACVIRTHTHASVSEMSTTVMPFSQERSLKGDDKKKGVEHDLEAGGGARLEHGGEGGAVSPLNPPPLSSPRSWSSNCFSAWFHDEVISNGVGATVSNTGTLSLDQLCAQSVIIQVNESPSLCLSVSVCVSSGVSDCVCALCLSLQRMTN